MLKFTKMHGLGNDYVYMDCTAKSGQHIDNPSSLAQIVSDRHFGIGSDGLILICDSEVADFRMKMFNQDGSEAQMCGNGIRCVGKFVYDKGLTNKEIITVETLAGIKTLKLNVEEGKVKTVRVDMGEPIFDLERIPVKYEMKEEFPTMELEAEGRKFACKAVSMGNPHAITMVEDVEHFDVQKYGSILEVDSHFPEKANIEFIELVDKNNIKMRVWERGSGETLACGTGATAVVAACHRSGYIERNAKVHLLGGTLEFEWKEDNHIYMTGPATTVFEGTIE